MRRARFSSMRTVLRSAPRSPGCRASAARPSPLSRCPNHAAWPPWMGAGCCRSRRGSQSCQDARARAHGIQARSPHLRRRLCQTVHFLSPGGAGASPDRYVECLGCIGRQVSRMRLTPLSRPRIGQNKVLDIKRQATTRRSRGGGDVGNSENYPHLHHRPALKRGAPQPGYGSPGSGEDDLRCRTGSRLASPP